MAHNTLVRTLMVRSFGVALILVSIATGMVHPSGIGASPVAISEQQYFQLTGAWDTFRSDTELPVRRMSFGPALLDQSSLMIDLGLDKPAIQLDLTRFAIESIRSVDQHVVQIQVHPQEVFSGYVELRFQSSETMVVLNHVERAWLYGAGGEEVFRRRSGPVLLGESGLATVGRNSSIYLIPTTAGHNLGRLRVGDTVEVVARLGAFPLPPDDEWSKVRAPGGLEGWVLTEDLRKLE